MKKYKKGNTDYKKHLLMFVIEWRLFSIFSLAVLFVIIFLTVNIIQNDKQVDLRTQAAGPGCKCNDPNKCYPDGCSRDPSKIGGDCGGNADLGPEPGVVNETLCRKPPDCCAGGGGNCCWIERGFCTLAQCGGSAKNACAWYWIWHDGETSKPQGYGCMKGSSPETMVPVYDNSPTTLPQPTVQPTAQPTITPTQLIITVSPSIAPTSNISPTAPIYTVTPPQYLSPTRPYNPNPTPTYYFPPTNSFPSGGLMPTIYNPSVTFGASPQPTTAISKPIINFPNPKPAIRKVIEDTRNLIQKMKNSLEDFFRVVLP